MFMANMGTITEGLRSMARYPARYTTSRRRDVLAFMAWMSLIVGAAGVTACSTTAPKGVEVVTGFDVQRYGGLWYEIARLDHSFERGLSNVTARYGLQADGSITVTNRGFNLAKQKWSEAQGVAKFIGPADRGSLKVSFFGPFYGGYHVVALDPSYQWSVVMGPDTDYLWILSRKPELPPGIKDQLIVKARSLGIETDKLIWVDHAPKG